LIVSGTCRELYTDSTGGIDIVANAKMLNIGTVAHANNVATSKSQQLRYNE